MMIQWIAAAMAQKELIYFCFGDVKLANEMSLIAQKHGSSSAGMQFCKF
jgi:Poly (ADP-ribose) glycohydrolase (PARG)